YHQFGVLPARRLILMSQPLFRTPDMKRWSHKQQSFFLQMATVFTELPSTGPAFCRRPRLLQNFRPPGQPPVYTHVQASDADAATRGAPSVTERSQMSAMSARSWETRRHVISA